MKIFRYGTLAAISVAVQTAILIAAVYMAVRNPVIDALSRTLTIIMILVLINSRISPAYKLCWAVPMLIFIQYGGIIYCLFNRHHSVKAIHKKMKPYFERKTPPETELSGLKRIMAEKGFLPCNYKESRYYSFGEEMFADIVKYVQAAERYIYIEFFIIARGSVWNELEAILTEKAANGVKIRIITDGAGSLFTKPLNFRKRLEKIGIEYAEFNPVPLYATASVGYRSHRKILVCDGKAAFCGGINLADEYMNRKERFGLWKDGGFLVKGKAAKEFEAMFMQMWTYLTKTRTDVYSSEFDIRENLPVALPFSDTPLDTEPIGLKVYLSLIDGAQKSIFLTTPYLACSDEMLSALCKASERGVDVRIIVPHIPDKKYVFIMTRGNYPRLLRSGVRIFEYTPGFIHAKNLIIDEETAVIGSINYDFRSMYLMFECGCLFYGGSIPIEAAQDFYETQKISTEITLNNLPHENAFVKISRAFLHLFEPLM